MCVTICIFLCFYLNMFLQLKNNFYLILFLIQYELKKLNFARFETGLKKLINEKHFNHIFLFGI